MTPASARAMGWAGIALAAVMAVLLKIGTTSLPLFLAEGAVLLAGLGLFALGRRIDSQARRRAWDDDRRRRQAEQPPSS